MNPKHHVFSSSEPLRVPTLCDEPPRMVYVRFTPDQARWSVSAMVAISELVKQVVHYEEGAGIYEASLIANRDGLILSWNTGKEERQFKLSGFVTVVSNYDMHKVEEVCTEKERHKDLGVLIGNLKEEMGALEDTFKEEKKPKRKPARKKTSKK